MAASDRRSRAWGRAAERTERPGAARHDLRLFLVAGEHSGDALGRAS